MKKEKFISVSVIIVFFAFLNPVFSPIYEGYKKIAFEIKYEEELARIDYWKTPQETYLSRKGDCEDAAFLFLDSLAMSQKNGGIVWGWVINKETGMGKAHVWCELIARDGIKYIVEPFSYNWNGITAAKNKSEYRKHIFKLSCVEFNHLAKYHHKWDIQVDYKELFVIDSLMYGYVNNSILYKNFNEDYDKKQVIHILEKLQKYFARNK